MYLDKLDGRIDAAFFDRKAAEWRAEPDSILSQIAAHTGANQNYIEEGVRLLELAQGAQALFEKQPALEKRKLLDFLLSNCTWKGGELTVQFRRPFDMLAVVAQAQQTAICGTATTSGTSVTSSCESAPELTHRTRSILAIVRDPVRHWAITLPFASTSMIRRPV